VQLPLKPLSETGVAAVLGEYLGLDAAGRIAPEFQGLSAGRPLLVHALAEDCAITAEAPEPGPAIGRSVLSCLYRSEPAVLTLAQAIAVLGERGSPSVVARFCDMAPASVAEVVASVELEGLLGREFLEQP